MRKSKKKELITLIELELFYFFTNNKKIALACIVVVPGLIQSDPYSVKRQVNL